MSKPPSGHELIEKIRATVQSALPVSGVLTIKEPSVKGRYEFKALKPGFLLLIAYDGEHVVMEQHWHDKTFYTYTPSTRLCIKSNAENPLMPMALILMGFESAFSKEDIYASVGKVRATSFEHQKAYGIEVQTAGPSGSETSELFIDRETFLPVGFVQGIMRGIYSDVVVNADLKKSDFDWSPPKGANVQSLKQ